MPSYFTLHDRPRLRAPVLVAAFQGWNDAAEAASAAVRFMVDAWSAPVVATLDPEEFFDFTQTRPRVRLLDAGRGAVQAAAQDGYRVLALRGAEGHRGRQARCLQPAGHPRGEPVGQRAALHHRQPESAGLRGLA